MTQLVMSMNTAKGSRFFHRLNSRVALRFSSWLEEQNINTQLMFCLTNHAPGCNWDNYEQLEYSRNQDAGAFLCNPCFTLLKTWKRVTATIVAARQESVSLSKDGKTLLGQVLSSLMAKQNPTSG
jgi:hypothetical protein